jgi:hypothetical protein
MEASDMIDVIHYFFEEDMNMSTGEQAEAKEEVRKSLYLTLYGTTYNYASGVSKGKDAFIEDDDGEQFVNDLKPFDPLAPATKPYVSPTRFDPNSTKPFGSVLDAPIG